jgi:hypothetical protein
MEPYPYTREFYYTGDAKIAWRGENTGPVNMTAGSAAPTSMVGSRP